ncbi:hypothetical protein [Frankia sp. R82]|uniref:hypothetical protein n=1 Tax=Frankia sp. R82 TaxID=2950553 RepID=UPI00204363A7|nr:hypothetical protein [Frankia sp. R82]MCM3886133.1 hypothetical protein [Frankia sp. R82]
MNHENAGATATVNLPSPHAAGERAAVILDSIEANPLFDRLRTSTLAYPECWATFTGYPQVAEWDLDADGPNLFVEALRTMAMKAAVYELTGDEQAAELDVAAPVDEMVHALTAQFTVLSRIQADLSVTFIHSTDNERFGYDAEGYTDQVYRAAGWGEPPRRYWLAKAETARRLGILFEHYESIGVQAGGRSHFFTFGR